MRHGMNSQSGSGIIEAIITVGLLAILAITVAGSLENQSKNQAQVQAKLSYLAILQDILRRVEVPSVCDSSLTVNGALTPNGQVPARLRLGDVVVREGAALVDYGNLVVNHFKLENINLEAVLPNTKVYSADLVVGTRSPAGFSFKPAKAARLLLTTNTADAYLKCTGQDAASTCSNMGGSYDPTRTPQCKLGANTRLCYDNHTTSTGGINPNTNWTPNGCCNPNEKQQKCVRTGASSNSSGLPGNVTRHSVSYICQCTS